VSGFEKILDQKRPIERLKTFLRKGTLPHAFLFAGTDGVGKQTCALALAMACNCLSPVSETDPCGRCASCVKIQSNAHPDIIRIKRAGQLIKVDQIRRLGKSLILKPHQGKKRVVIISGAQDMNPGAGATLLKMLEEPGANDMFILTTISASDLLPTIVSRCHRIRFNPISSSSLAGLIINHKGISPEHAEKIAVMANGSFTRAVSLCETGWIKRREWIITEISSLDFRPMGLVMAFAEKLSRNSESIGESFEIILSFLRDVMIGKHDPSKIINKDMAGPIIKLSEISATDDIMRKIRLIGVAQNKINKNANVRLALEELFIHFRWRAGKSVKK